jgi:protein-disulfide isomerase
MTRIRHLLPALLLTAALPNSGWAEMAADERREFREEVRAYLLENPEILTEMVALLEARQKAEADGADRTLVAAHADAIFDDGFSYVGGDPDGDVTLVEFMDYQCGYCRRAHPEVMGMIAADGGIRYVVKELPILGPGSELAARAAHATLISAGPEAYGRLHDALLGAQGPITDASLDAALADVGVDVAAVRAAMDDPEVDRRIQATMELAQALNIQGTPTFVLQDRMVRGFVPASAMQALVDEIRGAQ